MNRDSKGRFARKNSDDVLIERMNLNVNNGSIEIPVKDNRKKVAVKSNDDVHKLDNGPVYNIDKNIISRAIKNINKLGLGSLDHPVKIDNFFDKFSCECSKEKKTDNYLIKTLSENIEKCENNVTKNEGIIHPGFANSRRISWFGNKEVGDSSFICISLNEKDFVVSFNETIMVSINIEANKFPNIISFLKKLKHYDYFTITFNTYDINGYQTSEMFDGFKLFDLTYVGEKDIYNITLTKDNI